MCYYGQIYYTRYSIEVPARFDMLTVTHFSQTIDLFWDEQRSTVNANACLWCLTSDPASHRKGKIEYSQTKIIIIITSEWGCLTNFQYQCKWLIKSVGKNKSMGLWEKNRGLPSSSWLSSATTPTDSKHLPEKRNILG